MRSSDIELVRFATKRKTAGNKKYGASARVCVIRFGICQSGCKSSPKSSDPPKRKSTSSVGLDKRPNHGICEVDGDSDSYLRNRVVEYVVKMALETTHAVPTAGADCKNGGLARERLVEDVIGEEEEEELVDHSSPSINIRSAGEKSEVAILSVHRPLMGTRVTVELLGN